MGGRPSTNGGRGEIALFSIQELEILTHRYNTNVLAIMTQHTRDHSPFTLDTFPPPPVDVATVCGIIEAANRADFVSFVSIFKNQVAAITVQYKMSAELNDFDCTEFIEDRIDAISSIRLKLDSMGAQGLPTRLEMVNSIYGEHGPTDEEYTSIDTIIATRTEANEASYDRQFDLYDKCDYLLHELPRRVRRFVPINVD
jgi:hypothetical protein